MNKDMNETKEDINLNEEIYLKEIKALQILYGESKSAEELLKVLKEKNGDVSKVIDDMVSDFIEAKQEQTIISDSLYSQRLLEIDSIDSIDLKSQKVLFYACLYAREPNNQIFVNLMERYAKTKKINVDVEFDFSGVKLNLLCHMVYPNSANNAKCARYLLASELVNKQQIEEALKLAISFQNEEAIKLIISIKNLEERQKEEREYASRYLREKEKSEIMLSYLKKNSSSKEYEQIMKIMCQSVQAMIKDSRLICSQMFNMCWMFDKKEMWNSILQKCQQMLNSNNHINADTYQWQWIHEHLLENRDLLCWLDADNDRKQIRFEEIQKFCIDQSQMELKKYEKVLKEEMEKNEEKMLELIQWKYEKTDSKYKNKNNCRQDTIKYGIKSLYTAKELLQMQMLSNDMSFHPKQTYDYDVCLSELLTRAHIMDASFQKEMKRIFVETSRIPCEFKSGPIKSHARCKMKAQVEYADCAFPRSAHIIDIIRCQATYNTFESLKFGLDHFIQSIEHKSDLFQVMRVKNGFINRSRSFEQRQKDNEYKVDEIRTKKLKLLVPQEYQDIKINLIYTYNHQSIVTEIQFLANAMAIIKEELHPLYEVSRLFEFMASSHSQTITNSFDTQLQTAGFHSYALAPLMLHYPLQFQTSSFTLHEKDHLGKNFICKMAFNSNVEFQCAKYLLQSGDFIPLEIVQKQLMEPNNRGTYAIMFALWKKSSIPAIELYIPSNTEDAKKLWHALDTQGKSCVDFAARNTVLDISLLLPWLKKNIHDEDQWQAFIQMQERVEGMSPLMQAVLNQSNLSKDVIELLIPKNYKENDRFWELRCNMGFDQCTLLHLAFQNVLRNLGHRLKLLQEYVPDEAWQKMLCTTDAYGFTPLMRAMWLAPEMNKNIISLLTPKKADANFWKLTVNEKANRTKGYNLLHLGVTNVCGNGLLCLRCLRERIGEEMWKELLNAKNTMLLKETPLELARRIQASGQIINELM